VTLESASRKRLLKHRAELAQWSGWPIWNKFVIRFSASLQRLNDQSTAIAIAVDW